MQGTVQLPPDTLLIDVRSEQEWAEGHLAGAVHVPLEQLQRGVPDLAPDLTRTLVLYCASGGRSAFGCGVLQQLGYTRPINGGGLQRLALVTGLDIVRS